MIRNFSIIALFLPLLFACSVSKEIGRSAERNLFQDSSLKAAHVGISIYDPLSAKYLYNYQGDKYFVPASNTKIPTTYAALKYLGDSLIGLEYFIDDSTIIFRGTGDPTLLHPDFKHQPVINFLKRDKRNLALTDASFRANRWGSGWGVGDITASYAPERSELPVYGNTLRIFRRGDSIASVPSFFLSNINTPASHNWQFSFDRPSHSSNVFISTPSGQTFRSQEIPFITGNFISSTLLLKDSLKKEILYPHKLLSSNIRWNRIHSQPTDSLLKPLMHRSDNFFAEQTLLMVSNKFLGFMSDSRIIDTILKTDFKDLPHKPRWADGSGLSRYNLFTPQDFVLILNKMKNEFGLERLKVIFPTGNEGTLTNYYKELPNRIYAKTGTLSGVVALSGLLITKKNKLLLFSVLVNNHNSSAPAVRRAVERFILNIYHIY